MTEEERDRYDQTIPTLAIQGFGLVCLLLAVLVIYDGWYVLGALGVTLTFGRVNDLHEMVVLLRAIVRRRRQHIEQD